MSLALALCWDADAQLAPEPATVRIGVLSLFHPRTLLLKPAHTVWVSLDGRAVELHSELAATLQADGDRMYFGIGSGDGPGDGTAGVRTLSLALATFTLAVPGKLTRNYRGGLTVTARKGRLIPVIEMETETAVASIVAAESPPGAPLEALKAQAVASRSFLLANPHAHPDFDACDTTHCQFLRSPPASDSAAAVATRATSHMVLAWRSGPDAPVRVIAAMYSRSCGGQTRLPAAKDGGAYPFYSVRCEYCRRHPELWSRPAGTPAPANEQERLAWNRAHGWEAIPSGTVTASASGLEGRGTGHGIGLCQLGAEDLAKRGETFVQILGYYYPNTALPTIP